MHIRVRFFLGGGGNRPQKKKGRPIVGYIFFSDALESESLSCNKDLDLVIYLAM
jgi:hypothetical protein